MSDKKADIKEDIHPVIDDGEDVSLMEPLLVSSSGPHHGRLADLALELASKSTGLRKSLPSPIVTALSDLVRSMNCYYSNLIEGHDTHPIEIERAMTENYSNDPKQRNLQLEAKAHINVQAWIDTGALKDRAASTDGILELHQKFCELLPDELLWIDDPQLKKLVPVIPGQTRDRYVKVGQHVAISPGALPRFMARFERAYSGLGKVDAILAAATAHHRLLWLHPFLDGNGRVARLMSYAMLDDVLDTGGIWSIARGLARKEQAYKQHLAACDIERRGDLDGRGNLSEAALANFARFFLEACIDQVTFMEGLVQPDRLRSRILIWAEEEIRTGSLPIKSGQLLEAILYRGELPRGEVGGLLGVTDRHARRITSALLDKGVLSSKSIRAPLRLAFPATLASRWMPGLFPDQV